MKFKLTEKKIAGMVLLFSLVVMAIPWLLRFLQGNLTLMGGFSYHHVLLSENASLLFQSRFFTPYDLILSGLNSLIQTEIWSIIVLALLGAGTVLLFNNFLKKFKLTLQERFLTLIFFVISPVFIYFFTFSNQYALVVFLMILIINLLNLKSKLKYLAWPLFLILPFFDVLTSILILGFLLVYWIIRKDRSILYLTGIFLVLSIIVQIFYPQPLVYDPVHNIYYLVELFSDLGGLRGISFFTAVLAFSGLMVTWKQRRIFYFAYPSIILLLILFNFSTGTIIYFNFILSFFAGVGLFWLWKRKWKLNFLRNLSVAILLMGIILSTASYIGQVSRGPPNLFVKGSMLWLKDHSQSGEIVLSHPSKSFWIKEMAGREAFLDIFEKDYDVRMRAANDIFYSREIDLTIQRLEENKIKYIWIDMEMLRGQVWTDEDQGLLFLFRNPRFRSIYTNRGIEIWRFD